MFNLTLHHLCLGDQLKSSFVCNECGYGTSSLAALQVQQESNCTTAALTYEFCCVPMDSVTFTA
jgi:hypothetical protein